MEGVCGVRGYVGAEALRVLDHYCRETAADWMCILDHPYSKQQIFGVNTTYNERAQQTR